MARVFVVPGMSAMCAVVHRFMVAMSGALCWARGTLRLGMFRVSGLNRSRGEGAMMVMVFMHVTLSLSSRVWSATVNLSTDTMDDGACLDHYSDGGPRRLGSSKCGHTMTNPLFKALPGLAGTLLLAMALAAPALGQAAGDSAAVAGVVAQYHKALASGDSATALALLAEDAVILESGGVESLQEYRSHHLPADIAFAQTVKTTRSPVRVTVRGEVAWTHATSTARGKYRGKTVSSTGAESMVLTRGAEGWTIRAIHWSSRDG
jgi:ketosteroid isomerase-like protein